MSQLREMDREKLNLIKIFFLQNYEINFEKEIKLDIRQTTCF